MVVRATTSADPLSSNEMPRSVRDGSEEGSKRSIIEGLKGLVLEREDERGDVISRDVTISILLRKLEL